ncbi:hypothetical protein IG631_10947 [Alternaria alternata]|nr:hypothetical protein IG631_10947 [Alternaria alternata]
MSRWDEMLVLCCCMVADDDVDETEAWRFGYGGAASGLGLSRDNASGCNGRHHQELRMRWRINTTLCVPS